jgi:putative transferase (TIGR04331 family)
MAEKKPWPERPKYIFTSNNFDADDLFKIWTTKKINGGAKYYIGQHGNNYGTHRYMNPSIEEETADKFFTWGWKGELKQHIPMFIFKTVGMVKGSYNRQQKKLLLIQLPLGNRCNTWDNYAEYSKYIDDQISFISNLNQNCKTELIVRMHSASKHVEWGGYAKFREFDRNLQIDDGNSRIEKLIAESRYVVYSYDSTGMLETLSLNIPTLAFWQNGLDHLRESAKPYYKLLIDAEIIHLSPESLAKKLNSIWDDAEGIWWKSESVQYARHRFCEQYARELSNPLQALKAEFIS